MVLGPSLAVFLLEKPSHFRSADHCARHGFSGGEYVCDKAAHCEDSGMEEKTFPIMRRSVSLGPDAFSYEGLELFLPLIDMLL
jgi:hypothetical protein